MRLAKAGLLPNERQVLLEQIGANLDVRIIKPEQRWMSRYNQLKAFYLKDRDIYVKRDGLPEELRLWSSKQRDMKAKNKLNSSHLKLLEEIEFPLSVVDARWYAHLEEFKDAFNSSVVIKRSYDWINLQRTAFDEGKLSKAQISALKKANFDFRKRYRFNYATTSFKEHRHYNEFCRLIKKYGYISEENTALRALAKRLKKLHAKGQLAVSSVKLLDKMGFVLRIDIDARTERCLRDYMYHIKNKIPYDFTSGVWKWASQMRRQKAKGRLAKDVIERLTKEGFDWEENTISITDRDYLGRIIKVRKIKNAEN